MEIYAGLIFYNDGPQLFKECLEALIAAKIKPICIDGAYANFPRKQGEEFFSTDGCLELAKQYAHTLVECPKDGWPNQVDKRNRYFEIAPAGSYVLWIDADEVLRFPDFDFSILTDDVYRVTVRIWDGPETTKQWTEVRLFKNYPDLRHKYQHCRTYHLEKHDPAILDSGLVAKAHSPILFTYKVCPFFYNHYRFRRPSDRIERKTHFYKNRPEAAYGY